MSMHNIFSCGYSSIVNFKNVSVVFIIFISFIKITYASTIGSQYDAETLRNYDNTINVVFNESLSKLKGEHRLYFIRNQTLWLNKRAATCKLPGENIRRSIWYKIAADNQKVVDCLLKHHKERYQYLKNYDIEEILLKIENQSYKADNNRHAHIVSVYESEWPLVNLKTGYMMDRRKGGNIDIHIKPNSKIKSIVLILFSQQSPINWRIKLESGVKIEKVLLSGPEGSKVSGITDVSVTKKRMNSSYKKLTPTMLRHIKKFTNAKIQPFQGEYRGEKFIIQ